MRKVVLSGVIGQIDDKCSTALSLSSIRIIQHEEELGVDQADDERVVEGTEGNMPKRK
jgi:hypothetical protein